VMNAGNRHLVMIGGEEGRNVLDVRAAGDPRRYGPLTFRPTEPGYVVVESMALGLVRPNPEAFTIPQPVG